MSKGNRGKIHLKLYNALGQPPMRDKLTIILYNQNLKSRDRRIEVELKGKAKHIPNVLAQPDGLYEMRIVPKKHREKKVGVVLVRPNDISTVEDTFLLDPGKVTGTFPGHKMLGGPLLNKIGETQYNQLTDLEKGGLLNLYAVLQHHKVSTGESVFSFVQQITKIRQDRIFVLVSPALLKKVKASDSFHSASGISHVFPKGYKLKASFKTPEKNGNLQLTFAKNSKGSFLVDADVDDHQGIAHATDVMKHMLTGKGTHPYGHPPDTRVLSWHRSGLWPRVNEGRMTGT